MIIRLATEKDKRGIHDAHMGSIQKLCSKDYNEEQIQVWGHREFLEERRTQSIAEEACWVIVDEERIIGFGEINNQEDHAYVAGLYFLPEATGKGLGRELMDKLEGKAKSWKKQKVILHATITSLEFYKKIGYQQVGEGSYFSLSGVDIPCFEMIKKL